MKSFNWECSEWTSWRWRRFRMVGRIIFLICKGLQTSLILSVLCREISMQKHHSHCIFLLSQSSFVYACIHTGTNVGRGQLAYSLWSWGVFTGNKGSSHGFEQDRKHLKCLRRSSKPDSENWHHSQQEVRALKTQFIQTKTFGNAYLTDL